MKILYFLSEKVFRFKYRDSVSINENGNTVWDIGIHEDENEKAYFDFFFMGFVIGSIITTLAAGMLWLLIP